MPGVYELLLDEDMTIGSGNDSEEMAFHITHAGMAPVTRTIELYRPKITAGETLTVESDGMGHADLKEWLGVAPSALISNRVDTHVGAMAGSVVTAAAIDTDAITSAELATSAVNEIRDAVTGGAYALDTDANGRVRVVDGTGAGEIDTASGRVQVTEAQIDQIVDEVWDEDATGHQTQGTFGQAIGDPAADTDTIYGMLTDLEDGTTTVEANVASMDAGSVTAAAVATDAIDADALAADAVTEIQSGLATSANQTTILNRIGAFTGSGVNTILGFFQAVARSDATTPSDMGGDYDDATDSLEAIRDRGDAAWTSATPPTAAAIADAVWDEDATGHQTTGTFGAAIGDPAANTETIYDAVVTDATGINVATDINNLNDISTAQVNAEVLDVLDTDTFGEPTGVPPASASITDKLGYVYMGLRNKITVTSTKKTFFDDSDNAEWEKDLSDDGSTYTETEANAI